MENELDPLLGKHSRHGTTKPNSVNQLEMTENNISEDLNQIASLKRVSMAWHRASAIDHAL